jgi:hypothetical protein
MPLFNLSFLEPLTTITKRVHITEMPEHKDPLLTLSMYIDKAREEYRQRNVNDIQKEKDVPGFKISSFVSTSQNNVEEVGATDSEEGTSCGFCNEQYNCRNSSPFRHCIQRTKCAVIVPLELHWRQRLWKIQLLHVYVRKSDTEPIRK